MLRVFSSALQAKAKLDRAEESLRLTEHEGSINKWQQQLAALENRLNEVKRLDYQYVTGLPHL